MSEECGEVVIRLGVVLGGKTGYGLCVCAIDSGDLDLGDSACGSGVGLAYVAGAD